MTRAEADVEQAIKALKAENKVSKSDFDWFAQQYKAKVVEDGKRLRQIGEAPEEHIPR